MCRLMLDDVQAYRRQIEQLSALQRVRRHALQRCLTQLTLPRVMSDHLVGRGGQGQGLALMPQLTSRLPPALLQLAPGPPLHAVAAWRFAAGVATGYRSEMHGSVALAGA